MAIDVSSLFPRPEQSAAWRRDFLEQALGDAIAYYPERLAAYRDALQEQGFDAEQSASLTEVLFDHLLAATLGRNGS